MPKWVVACLVSVLLWGVWGLVFAVASGSMTPLMVNVLTTVGLIPVVVGLLLSRDVWEGNRVRRGVAWGIATGLCGTVGNVALAGAYALGAEATIVAPLTAMYPLVTLVLAVVFLSERLNLIQVMGMGIALVAIYLFSSAGGSMATDAVAASLATPWMLSTLVALILFGIAGVTQKVSTNDISNELATICYWVGAVIVSGGILATQRFDWSLTTTAWVSALGAGVLIGLALWFGFAAYRGGKASVVTAMIALYPVVTVALAVPLLGETLDLIKGVAIALAILAALALTYEKPGVPTDLPASPATAAQPTLR